MNILKKFSPSLLFIVVVFLIYSHILHSPFQFDDVWFIVDNYTIRDIKNLPLIWEGVLAYPTRFITFFTFALNYHFHQLDVFGYHLTNVLIHLLNGGLVYWLVQQLCAATVTLKNKKEEGVALVSALIFLVHPVQTQAVTFITQRFACLAALFYLLSLCFYIKGRSLSSKNIHYFVGAGLAAFLGMLSKEMTLTLPLMILLIEYCFFKPQKFKRFKSQYLFLLIGFGLIVPYFYSFKLSAVFAPKLSLSHLGDQLTPYTYALTQVRVLVTYLRLLFWPVNQNLDYDYPMSTTWADVQVIGSMLILITLLLAGFKIKEKEPLISFGIFWFFLTLSINFLPRQNVIAEHNLYLPSVGFALAVSAGVFTWTTKKQNLQIVLTGLILLLGMTTIKRNFIWQTEVKLWEDTVKKSPGKYTVYQNLAQAYINADELDRAQITLAKALQINPNFELAYNDRGNIFLKLGLLKEAIGDFDKAIAIDPHLHQAYNNRAICYQRQKMYDHALQDYNQAIQIVPHYAQAYNNRGSLYLLRKEFLKAKSDFEKSIELTPHDSKPYLNLAVTYQYQQNSEAALHFAQRAAQMGHPKAAHFIERIKQENQYKN
ncbi:MAG: tetratricopeptide repeat protein [Candidatus Omnitrophica bacterium]|nr:tetratricopeptide repeat protein [Candidatus Omnitrophota bacterium]